MHFLRIPDRLAPRSPSLLIRLGPLLAGLLAVAGCSTVGPQAPAPVSSPAPATVSASLPAGARPAAPGADAAPDATMAPPAQAPAAPPSASGPARPDERTAAAAKRPDPLESLPAPTGRPPQADVATANLWDRIRAGFAMPPLGSPLVARHERFYLERPDYMQRMFSRASRYLFHIVEEIEKRGMPTELALLPFVESAMNPVALSSARAAGLWQFIPSTGRAYNLQQDWWVDNRRDVVKSTEAALDYLQKIYAMHGNDWFLALASYNWGEGAVSRAVRSNQARGRPAGYLSLRMPAETRNYVPKLMALKNIVMNAERLGVALPELPNRPYFVTLEKTRPIDLKLAAQFAGMTVDEFVALNPAHNRPVIAASRDNLIKLPTDRLDDFMVAVERHGQENRAFATWQPHTMKQGETLEALAQRGGVTVAELREANGLRDGRRILPGTRILAPQRAVEDETRVERFDGARVYELVERPAAYHKVRARDTLTTIARRYRTTVANLRAWNRLDREVKPGMTLMVRPSTAQTMLTTENGDRRVLSSQSTEPRVMRAVLRRDEAAPAVGDEAAAKRPPPATRATRPAAKRTATAARKTSAAKSPPAAGSAPPNRGTEATRTSSDGPAARRPGKRT